MKTPAEKLDLSKINELSFQKPDLQRFPALSLARDALKMGGAMPNMLNAANEVAVDYFLNKKISFLNITRVIDDVLNKTPNITLNKLDDVMFCDLETRKKTEECIIPYLTCQNN
jgi:1-deoxy-D-xylulose-5-phosphate reductoisomerase